MTAGVGYDGRPLLRPLNPTDPQYLVMLALWERSPRSLNRWAPSRRPPRIPRWPKLGIEIRNFPEAVMLTTSHR